MMSSDRIGHPPSRCLHHPIHLVSVNCSLYRISTHSSSTFHLLVDSSFHCPTHPAG
jgi:hypothetical protein